MKKPSRKIQSIDRNQNALVRAVFERPGDAHKVLYVALDYVKRKHVAPICDGHGDILKGPFPLKTTRRASTISLRKSPPPPATTKSPKTRSFLAARTKSLTTPTSSKPFEPKAYSSLE